MVAIPQITRDKLASSLVGTPGVDTSGEKIGNSLAEAGAQIGQAVGQFAVERQSNLDQAESNKLMVDYKQSIINLAEGVRRQYQNDPDKGIETFQEGVKNLLPGVQQQASNQRVSLMIGKGDPMFEGRIMAEQANWAYTQKTQNNYKDATNQTITLGQQAGQIGSDINMTVQEKWNKFTQLHDPLGNVINSMKGVQSDETVEKFSRAAQADMATGLVHGMMDTAPWDAKTVLQHPDMKAVLGDRWEKMNGDAEKAIQGYQKKHEINELFQNTAEANTLMRFAANGKDDQGQPFNYATIDKLRQASGNKPIYDYLENHILAPKSTQEKAEDVVNFYAEANRIGMQYHRVPAETSLHDLISFNDKLTKAWADGTINESTFRSMSEKLSTPLTEGVMKAHDVEKYQQAQKDKGFFGLFASQEAPETRIDKYNGGYDTINKWLSTQGQDKNWAVKAGAIKKYMDLSDSTTAQDRDYYGRPWTSVNLARKAMGVGDGDTIQTPIGPKTITGYNTGTGKPTVDFSKEEQDRLTHLKQLTALKVG